jgi:hypothetical protein
MTASTVLTLAAALDAADLGGAEPVQAARALLSALETQAGGTPEHHAAHAAQLLQAGPARLADLLAAAEPGPAQAILARLVHGGMPLDDVLALIAPKERTV